MGHAYDLDLTLTWGNFRAKLHGPVQIHELPTHEWNVDYRPETLISAFDGSQASPVQTHFSVNVVQKLNGISALDFDLAGKTFDWALIGIKSEDLVLSAQWSGLPGATSPAKLHLTAKTLSWTNPDQSDQALNATRPEIFAEVPLEFKPFAVGHSADVHFSLQDCEVLN